MNARTEFLPHEMLNAHVYLGISCMVIDSYMQLMACMQGLIAFRLVFIA
jgi:hypothetical protein